MGSAKSDDDGAVRGAELRVPPPVAVFVGWVGRLPRNLPVRPKRVNLDWLAAPQRPEPAVIVLGQNAISRLCPEEVVRGRRRARARVLICAEQAPVAAIVRWLRMADVEVVDPRELPLALASTCGMIERRPAAALDEVREALGQRVGKAGNSSNCGLVPYPELDALRRLSAMSVEEWCAALTMSPSTLSRRCRLAWDIHPHGVLDLYASSVIRILRAEGLAPAEIARTLGYETTRALDRVDGRVSCWRSDDLALPDSGKQD